jgi:hypothetical protein
MAKDMVPGYYTKELEGEYSKLEDSDVCLGILVVDSEGNQWRIINHKEGLRIRLIGKWSDRLRIFPEAANSILCKAEDPP